MTKYPNYLIILFLTFIGFGLANVCPLTSSNSQTESENNSNNIAIWQVCKYFMKTFTYLLFGNFGNFCGCN